MITKSKDYLMEHEEESLRLEVKTDPHVVQQQARWCGLAPGLRVLDAGCGPGKVTAILNRMVQPGGGVVGVDYSEDRIRHARTHYQKPGIEFFVHDLREPLEMEQTFDIVWARFLLEYNRSEGHDIVRNLSPCLKSGGWLCLLDLDYNCLSHYELPPEMESALYDLVEALEAQYNFDPYAGRKLYAYLYDLGYRNIQLDLVPHHLIYGAVRETDIFNWIKKVQIAATKAEGRLAGYPGGPEGFFADFFRFFNDPRRFTYTPLILCKGFKP